jgi:hypothetical protein
MLVFVLNERAEPQKVRLQSELDLWLPGAKNYEVMSYDSTGRRGDPSATSASWSGTTRVLAPCELAVFEIQAK